MILFFDFLMSVAGLKKKKMIVLQGLIMQAMTSTNVVEIVDCLRQLKDAAVFDQMHESFNSDNPRQVSRGWFAWANSLFGQLIVHLVEKYPSLMTKK